MTLVPSAGIHVASAERGKTGNQCKTRENMQSVPITGIHSTSAKHRKTCNQCQAQEYVQPVLCAGKAGAWAKSLLVFLLVSRNYSRLHLTSCRTPQGANTKPVKKSRLLDISYLQKYQYKCSRKKQNGKHRRKCMVTANSPGALWKIATVPSARATRTRACTNLQEQGLSPHYKTAYWLRTITGLEKRAVWSSGTGRISCPARNFSFSLAYRTRPQATHLQIKKV